MAIELTEEDKDFLQKLRNMNEIKLKIRAREKVMLDNITNLESSGNLDKWELIGQERLKFDDDTLTDRQTLETLETLIVR